MANICTTKIVCVSENAQSLKFLYDKMKGLQESRSSMTDSRFGPNGLGHLVSLFGFDPLSVDCQGSWSDLKFNGKVLSFNTKTEWRRCCQIDEILCQRFPSIKIFYYSEEPGMHIYETNDVDSRFFPQRYIVYYSKSGFTYCNDIAGVYEFIRKEFNETVCSPDDLQAFVKKINMEIEDFDIFLKVIEIDVVA